MNKLYIVLIVFLSNCFIYGQAIFERYERDFDDSGRSVVQTSDGGFATLGFKNASDIWLIKTDSIGNKLWDKTFIGGKGYSLIETSEGDFVIAGTTWSYGNGGSDVRLIKTDSNGDVVWDKTFGGISDDNGRSVVQTSDGGFAIAGSTSSYGNGLSDIWLIKTDSMGNKVWDKTFGGSKNEFSYSLVQLHDGGYAIAGSNVSLNPESSGISIAWLIRTDQNGNEEWNRMYGDWCDYYEAIDIVDDPVVNNITVLICRYAYVIYAKPDYNFIHLLTSTCVSFSYDGKMPSKVSYISKDTHHSFQRTNDRGFIFTGRLFKETTYPNTNYLTLVKKDSTGTELWRKNYEGFNGGGYSVELTDDSGYILTGYTDSTSVDSDVLLIKTDSAGDPVFIKIFDSESSTGSEYFTSMSVPFTPLSYSSNAWGDYDNDGDLDLLITGESATGVYCTKLYYNSAGTFTEVTTGMVNIGAGSVAWGDYDNDGDLDVLLSGYTGSGGVTKIYRNDGSGTFTDINAGLPGCYYNSVSWADYDNDGDLDILITGYVNSTTRLSEIYRNDGDGIFTDVNAGLINVSSSSAAWADYDNDGDPDILLTGYTSTGAVSKVYRNDNGVFTDINAGLTGVLKSSVAWGDYDNDCDLDILLTGMPTTTTYCSKVYRNDGGVFTDIVAGFTSAGYSSAICTDYNCDGYLDILLSGGNETTVLTKMYQNNLDGTFSETTHYLEPVKNCSVTACDYNNDGRSDYLISGSNGTERVTKLYKSNIPAVNTKPSTPTSLSSVLNGSDMILSWNKATDAQTQQNGLCYNLYIGISPLAGNKKSPMSNISTGYRKVVSMGNTNSKNSYTIKNLPPGTYYWSVQAVDNAYAGSLFGEEKMFSIDLSIPSNVNVVYAAGNVTLSWTAVPGAVSYKVYSSEEPYGTFIDVSSQGTLAGTIWSQAVTENKLFYYIVAVSGKTIHVK